MRRPPASMLLCTGLVATACTGADLLVRVRVPSGCELTHAVVRLAVPENSGCEPAEFGQRSPTPVGAVHFQTPWCGRARVIASAPELVPDARLIDTCRAGYVELSLSRQPEHVTSDAPAIRAVTAFIEALEQEDWRALAARLDDPATRNDYRGLGILRRSATRRSLVFPDRYDYAMTFSGTQHQFVDVIMRYDDGCQATWRFELSADPAEPKVRAVRPLTDPLLSHR